MHEFAIAESIIEIVKDNIKAYLKEDCTLEVEIINIRCGILKQIVPSVLLEAFKAIAKEDNNIKNAKLEIQIIDAKLLCLACNKEYTINSKEDILLPCPNCASVGSSKLLEGKEMFVDHIEVNKIEE